MQSSEALRTGDQCRHRFRCLLCSDTNIFCDCYAHCHKDHPKQPLVTDDHLLSQYGSKTDYSEYSEISVFNCPYCDKQKLSVGTLYDHITLEHLDVPFNVRCPICVCFGSNNSLIEGIHLSKHIVDDHSVTMEQYHEQILIYDTHCYDERELLIFLASTLPPTYHGGEDYEVESEIVATRAPSQAATSTAGLLRSPMPQAASSNAPRTIASTCAICLDMVLTARTLPCQHKFHAACIDLWLQQSATCPICRKPT
ncbi:AAEL009667-PA [Aedes aegypti]|uniref:AAEL009667-PA n=2 Tax=Aedes aegypti TaxID=7159 RepID=A0A1S4FN00_AEDAE|nr:uncharacterized protein LOC5572240 [Aedes aegypti]EAT38430.1 AAEL009667-PA [Aedes aegypti]